ncbi:hypothetical protein OXX79_003789 [Metschnikowia pulcherrima]
MMPIIAYCLLTLIIPLPSVGATFSEIQKSSVLESTQNEASPKKSTNQGLNGHMQILSHANESETIHNNNDAAAERLQFMLDDFDHQMRSLVPEGTFDVTGFEFRAMALAELFSNITELSSSIENNEYISAQYNFTRQMLHTMSTSAIMMKHYNTCELTGHGWVYKMIELNVRLLIAHDRYGRLDSSIPWPDVVLYGFWRDLQVSKRMFRMLSGVSYDMHVTFEEQLTAAENSLAALVSQSPGLSDGYSQSLMASRSFHGDVTT